jgi:SAM-dependent methyltransferase
MTLLFSVPKELPMTITAADHYKTHLAPVYVWMAGGMDAALARGDREIAAILPDLAKGATAVDLGAGFGMHAIPLARRGCSVIAIDTSALLLEELRRQTGTLPIKTAEDDLLSFQRHAGASVDVILIMGDTLTHLPDRFSVETLFSLAAAALRPAGRFIATFRDYTSPLLGNARFVPVRSDEDRILTCFLEYGADHVDVHDVLHERQGSVWQQRVSAYRKLRLAPQWVSAALRGTGFSVHTEAGTSGMVRIAATRI